MKHRKWLAALLALCMAALLMATALAAEADASDEIGAEAVDEIAAEAVAEIGAEAVDEGIGALALELDDADEPDALAQEDPGINAALTVDPEGDAADDEDFSVTDDGSEADAAVQAASDLPAEHPEAPADDQADGTVIAASDPKPLTDEMVTVATATYTGSALTPNVTVKDGDSTLTAGTDYEVTLNSAQEYTDAGEYDVTVTGKGNYTGTVTSKKFKIDKAVQEVEVKLKATSSADKVYDKTRNLHLTSADFEFSPKAATGDTLKLSKITGNYPEVDVNKYTFKISFEIRQSGRNYTYNLVNSPITVTGSITPKALTIRPGVAESSTDSTLVPQTKVYGTADPSSYKAKVGGIMSGDKLADAVSGKLSREPGENVGKYKITLGTIQTKGNYAATPVLEEGYFEITPKPINATDVGMFSLASQKYTGAAIEPAITLKYGSMTLVQGKDFDVLWSDNVEPGTATATIIGKGNFTDTRTALFTILKSTKLSIDSGDVVISAPGTQTYSGTAIEPEITVVYNSVVDGKIVPETLVKGTDYDVNYQNNTEPGIATVTVVGKGRFTGQRTFYFQIVNPEPTKIAATSNTTATVSAAPGTTRQLDLGGATGTKFKSSNRKIATVDQSGNVTFKKAGKVKITFKVGKKKRTVTLKVIDPTVPTSIGLNMTGTVAAKKGETLTLTCTLPEGTSSAIKWKSSNKKVATVKDGVVTFKKAGKVTITAIAKRGKKKAQVKFRVSK